MNLTEMANAVLAGWIALYHFAAIHIWPTARAVILAVSPFVVVATVFFWRPRGRAKEATSAATHSVTIGATKDGMSRH